MEKFNKYLTPRKISAGDTLYLVAPAGPIDTREVKIGIDVLKELGFKCKLGKCVKTLETYDNYSAPLKDRVKEMNDAFEDYDSTAVITLLGGFGSAELLPFLNYDVIRMSRKALLGISDITSLNCGILKKAGLISINGQYPSVRIDNKKNQAGDIKSLEFTLKLMMDPNQWGTRPFEINEYIPRTLFPGKATGPAIGVNFDTMVSLVGTPFFPNVDGAILFVEDVHKAGPQIMRKLVHFKLAGILDKINGIVFGEFAEEPKQQQPKDPSIENVIVEYFKNKNIPCCMGYSFSHGIYTIPIPVGAQTTMDASTGEISFDFKMY
jgi:muramoyltetrapeptide carboxypeptidase